MILKKTNVLRLFFGSLLFDSLVRRIKFHRDPLVRKVKFYLRMARKHPPGSLINNWYLFAVDQTTQKVGTKYGIDVALLMKPWEIVAMMRWNEN